MRRIPGFENVTSTGALDRPEVRIMPRLDEMARYGVTTEQISEAVRIATIGDIDANLAKFNAGDRLIPIRVQLTETLARRPQPDRGAEADDHDGRAPYRSRRSPTSASPRDRRSIDRYDRKRRVTIGVDLAARCDRARRCELINDAARGEDPAAGRVDRRRPAMPRSGRGGRPAS